MILNIVVLHVHYNNKTLNRSLKMLIQFFETLLETMDIVDAFAFAAVGIIGLMSVIYVVIYMESMYQLQLNSLRELRKIKNSTAETMLGVNDMYSSLRRLEIKSMKSKKNKQIQSRQMQSKQKGCHKSKHCKKNDDFTDVFTNFVLPIVFSSLMKPLTSKTSPSPSQFPDLKSSHTKTFTVPVKSDFDFKEFEDKFMRIFSELPLKVSQSNTQVVNETSEKTSEKTSEETGKSNNLDSLNSTTHPTTNLTTNPMPDTTVDLSQSECNNFNIQNSNISPVEMQAALDDVISFIMKNIPQNLSQNLPKLDVNLDSIPVAPQSSPVQESELNVQ